MMTSAVPSVNRAPLQGLRVLVVDDADIIRQVVTDILESGGAAVTAVSSAEAALAALQAEHPDVLVSDLSMPGNGGYWLIGQVRALPRERGGATPAAALTGATGPEHRERVLRTGFQRHVTKPFEILELVEVVADLARKE